MDKDPETVINKLKAEITDLKNQKRDIDKKINIRMKQVEELENAMNLKKSTKIDNNWSEGKFPWDTNVLKILQTVFKLKEFRLQQKAAINFILSKKDILLVMPTGGGKSLCYQIPALHSKGVTVVISPLLSLMDDQLMSLQKFNVTAYTMNSSTSQDKRKIVYDYLNKKEGHVQIIYVTPEWLSKSKKFLSALQKCYQAGLLERFAIDEVHCCSQWGHDFRPDYEFLSMLKHLFSGIPVIGLTATASMNVLLDIQKMLQIEGCAILTAPFDRKNLNFKVISKPETTNECVTYLYELITKSYKNMSGIIYTATVKDAKDLTDALRGKDVRASYYYADMDDELRTKVHKRWMNNHYQVIVATIAFGMGIDKPDCKFVIHYSIPKSLEAFYQEAGRAGRDGSDANCIILFRLADYMKQSAYAKSATQITNCQKILQYCLNISECRHYLLQNHFESDVSIYKCQSMCDNCKHPETLQIYNVAYAYKIISEILSSDEGCFTLLKLIDKWTKTMKGKAKISKALASNIIGNLLAKEYLIEERSYTAYTVNCYIKINYNNVMDDSNISVMLKKDAHLDTYLQAFHDQHKTVTPSKKRQRTDD